MTSLNSFHLHNIKSSGEFYFWNSIHSVETFYGKGRYKNFTLFKNLTIPKSLCCSLCKREYECTSNLFHHCPVARVLWNRIVPSTSNERRVDPPQSSLCRSLVDLLSFHSAEMHLVDSLDREKYESFQRRWEVYWAPLGRCTLFVFLDSQV